MRKISKRCLAGEMAKMNLKTVLATISPETTGFDFSDTLCRMPVALGQKMGYR